MLLPDPLGPSTATSRIPPFQRLLVGDAGEHIIHAHEGYESTVMRDDYSRLPTASRSKVVVAPTATLSWRKPSEEDAVTSTHRGEDVYGFMVMTTNAPTVVGKYPGAGIWESARIRSESAVVVPGAWLVTGARGACRGARLTCAPTPRPHLQDSGTPLLTFVAGLAPENP